MGKSSTDDLFSTAKGSATCHKKTIRSMHWRDGLTEKNIINSSKRRTPLPRCHWIRPTATPVARFMLKHVYCSFFFVCSSPFWAFSTVPHACPAGVMKVWPGSSVQGPLLPSISSLQMLPCLSVDLSCSLLILLRSLGTPQPMRPGWGDLSPEASSPSPPG